MTALIITLERLLKEANNFNLYVMGNKFMKTSKNMNTNKLIITIFPFAAFCLLCLSCKRDNYHKSRITPQIFPRSSTSGTQFRTRTKRIKSPIPAEVKRETDTVIIRIGMINRSGFADFKVD
jgi:hypothetical protein